MNDRLLLILAYHVGAGHGISAEKLAHDCGITTRTLRRQIEELRADGHRICGHPSRGYYLAETAEELEQTCQFFYSRAMASLTQIAAMKRRSLPDLAGQLGLESQPGTKP